MKEQMKALQKLKGIGEVLSRRLVESIYDTIAEVVAAEKRRSFLTTFALIVALSFNGLAAAQPGTQGTVSNSASPRLAVFEGFYNPA